jgi:CYTH domain-containing protein
LDSQPKYSLAEIERRWLVDLDAIGNLSILPYRDIEDRYIAGSRLRLRRIVDPEKGATFKLVKKYGKDTALSEAITNLYLSEEEYQLLLALPGSDTFKRRYTISGGVLDIYLRPNKGLAVFEVQFADEASAKLYQPPPFAIREVTSEHQYSGASLAGVMAD